VACWFFVCCAALPPLSLDCSLSDIHSGVSPPCNPAGQLVAPRAATAAARAGTTDRAQDCTHFPAGGGSPRGGGGGGGGAAWRSAACSAACSGALTFIYSVELLDIHKNRQNWEV
jgi:hypothetical protein